MSAIFGIVNKNGSAILETDVVKMQESLQHRAVDGQGIYCNANIMFGHHKLVAHRRQKLEQQPLQSDSIIITCDARIDNIDNLFEQLRLPKSQENYTDPFIILQAYKTWGNECAKYLEGEFCFAIWDFKKQLFLGATDQIGHRSFYYLENNDLLIFSSEIKAIEKVKREPLVFDHRIYSMSHKNHVFSYDKTIKYLRSAHHIELTKGITTLSKYWQPEKKNKYHFQKKFSWHEVVLKSLTAKIKCQIDSEYPVGVLLSGGLDSTLVTVIACQLLKKENRKLHAFCSVLPESYYGPSKDERIYIEKLKLLFDNLEVHYISVPEEDSFYSNLKESFERAEKPLLLLHYVDTVLYREAQKLNIRTLMSGFGGDETFSHAGAKIIYYCLRQLRFLSAFQLFYKKYRTQDKSFFLQLKIEVLSHLKIYKLVKSFLRPDKSDQKLIPFKKKKIQEMNSYPELSPIDSVIHSVSVGYTGHVIYSDKKYAQAFALELSAPLYDKSLLQLFFNMPLHLILQDGVTRGFFKKILRGLAPKEIYERTDKGYYSPNFVEKIFKFDNSRYQKLFDNKDIIEEVTGYDFDKLNTLVNTYKFSELKEISLLDTSPMYIPYVILNSEFFFWALNKNKQSPVV